MASKDTSSVSAGEFLRESISRSLPYAPMLEPSPFASRSIVWPSRLALSSPRPPFRESKIDPPTVRREISLIVCTVWTCRSPTTSSRKMPNVEFAVVSYARNTPSPSTPSRLSTLISRKLVGVPIPPSKALMSSSVGFSTSAATSA